MLGGALVGRGLILATLVVAPASAATAATPIDLGQGEQPHLTFDDTGVLHATWVETISGVDHVSHYCRIPASASACSNARAFTYPAGAAEGLGLPRPLAPGGNRVLVLDVRCCQGNRYVYSSGDGGQTFGDHVDTIGPGDRAADASGSALYAPAGAVGRAQESILTMGSGPTTAGLEFQATGTGPPAPGTTNDGFVITPTSAQGGSLVLSGSTLLATWQEVGSSSSDHAFWRAWSGAGDVNDPASWGPVAPVDPNTVSASTRLAAGPGGIYVATIDSAEAGSVVALRKFTGSGWGAPLALTDVGNPREFDLVQDTKGILHFAWKDDTIGLRYRRATSSANDKFTAPVTLASPGFWDGIAMAVDGTGEGWVAWSEAVTDTRIVRAVPLAVLTPPVVGRTVNAVPTKGRVRVKLPGTRRFVAIEDLGRQVPVGSTIDAKKGAVRLSLGTNNRGGTQSGTFSQGQFTVQQSRKNPLTTLSMTGGGLSACGKPSPGGAPKRVASGARKRRSRSLFSSVRGRFRTRGRHSTATVRGTTYLVKDSCKGTLTKVRSGRVVVRDLALRRTKVLKAGQSYLARNLNRRR